MFDSHCHLNFKAFADDAPAVANAMARNRVAGLVVGCDRQSSRTAIDLAQTFPNLWASVGLHPTHVVADPWDSLIMKELALEDRVVAIGEVGLDRYHLPADPGAQAQYLEGQELVLKAALELADMVNKPLVLHSRQAYDLLLDILEVNLPPRPPAVIEAGLRGTIHCFMGNQAQANRFLELGFMIGFTGVISYKEAEPELLTVVKTVPLDRILIETDSPYLTPEPYRSEGRQLAGKIPRNLPQYSLEVARIIGRLRELKTMTVVSLTEANAYRLFGLGRPPNQSISVAELN